MNREPKAVIYTRFSPRPNADDCDSAEHQAHRCRVYCDKKDYHVVGEYSDKAISGGILNRPELTKLLSLLPPGAVVVVDRNDRLARDLLINLTIQNEIKKLGGSVEFADGSPLQTNPEGRLFQNILAAFAQFEREKFSERTKNGMARKKAEGVWCGRPPIGWTKTKGENKLREYEPEQWAIAMIKEKHKQGYTSGEIASLMNKTPIKPGRPWSARTIRKILARPVGFPVDNQQ
jgi:DNA invertase Pin-like site-specific DNA recombinase